MNNQELSDEVSVDKMSEFLFATEPFTKPLKTLLLDGEWNFEGEIWFEEMETDERDNVGGIAIQELK